MKTTMSRFKKQVLDYWAACKSKRRVLKCSIASTAAVIAVMTPQAVAVLGPVTFLAPMATVFAHPGQRMGPMIEALIYVLAGTALGLGWSILGLYLSSLIVDENRQAAYAIRGIFLALAAIFHGYFRSAKPRLFLVLAFLLIDCLVVLLGSRERVSLPVLTNIVYPTLIGVGMSVITNLAIFPEPSSNFLGGAAVSALQETNEALNEAVKWFLTSGGDQDGEPSTDEEPRTDGEPSHADHIMTAAAKSTSDKPKHKKGSLARWTTRLLAPFRASQHRHRTPTAPVGITTIANLSAARKGLLTQLTSCKTAQRESNYEMSISVLPPRALKPLTTSQMSKLVQNIINIIGVCENKSIVLENDDGSDDDTTITTDTSDSEPSGIRRMDTFEDYQQRLENAKPAREINLSNAALLEAMVYRIREPALELQESIQKATEKVIDCVAYCYDVQSLSSENPTPKGISLHGLDQDIDLFVEAISNFDVSCSAELRRSRTDENRRVDFMPRLETFLVSSFVLALTESANHVLGMLRHVRKVVEQRQARNNRTTVWFPRAIDMQQYWKTGGETDGFVLPELAREQIRQSKPKSRTPAAEKDIKHVEPKTRDEEKAIRFVEPGPRGKHKAGTADNSKKEKSRAEGNSRILRIRGKAADTIEWALESPHLSYALKLASAILLLSWPALIDSWNPWYTSVRGIWAPMQLFLVFEVAIGTSVYVFAQRLCGVLFGCVVGLASYAIGRGNRVCMIFVLIVGIVPSFYVQLNKKKYVKAAMISTVSMVVVALSAANGKGTAVEIFYKRFTAFIIGGVVAMAVEMLVFPVRARDRLIEALGMSIKQVQKMQAAMAVGLDSVAKPNFRDPDIAKRFNYAKSKAQEELTLAETFLPMCSSEPRLKADFRPLKPIYREIIIVLRQIVEKMDNNFSLRKEYGSSILEDLHAQVRIYRRNVAASIELNLYSVYEALVTRQPLPQFMPSSRVAHFQLISRVRKVLEERSGTQTPAGGLPNTSNEIGDLGEEVARLIVQKRALSWNASTFGQGEIIEYLEELVELTKIIVGVNAFRSGLLERAAPYSTYKQRARLNRIPLPRQRTADSGSSDGSLGEVPTVSSVLAPTESRATGLQRTQTIRQGSLTKRRSHKKEEKGNVESDSEEDIPVSLQRVGTRLCENNAIMRRRAISMSKEGS
ncbi:uncharacterized protein B0J16DRAFT_115849 [Fusarium flagelliforme]|uniref:ER transporter 6TM N-terminal domain-containing protein n=1 Tax=Fusarium flagelliforme TaxID=2675880 RepID=A0A395MUI5_9HYPO|nr:uncharacterized protein B0J16DRAFT_115849 [Fusarium flagelliforme]KAH7189471.1 hypothetical protein B0J16DRAFT_115849 [Fusarium flagelliforme]RFN51275.1 hypothetical protein FIE12Z_4451 [Fusarium flagelliforme]